MPTLSPRRQRYLLGVLLGGAACFLGLAAWAQPVGDETPDAWKFSVGLGVASHPDYPGSADTRTSGFPMLSAYYGRYFIGGVPDAGLPFGAGVNLVQTAQWRLGVGLGADLDKQRKESDSPRLAGLGDIDGTAHGSAFASYNASWWRIGGHVVTDVGGNHQGTRVAMQWAAKFHPMERLELSAGPGFTWADSDYAQTFFGVTAAQSARSGLSTFTPGSGLTQVNFNIAAHYLLTPQWGLGASITAASLRGDAAQSPITEKKEQNTVGLFVNYRF